MHDDLPIMYSRDFSQATHDQQNDQWDYFALSPRLKRAASYSIEESGDVLNYVTWVMQLTQGKLLKQNDWHDWQDLEFLQLDQYFAQGMFGDLCTVTSDKAIFNLVWTYNIKALDERKKARCTCDGSPCSGWFGFLTRPMPTVWNRQVHTCSTQFQLRRTFSSLVLMYQMHLQKPPCLYRASLFGLTMPSMTGGPSISNAPQFLMATSSLSFPLCRATRSLHASGKSTPIPSSVKLD